MKAKVSKLYAFICLITAVFFCILACDNGSAPDTAVSKSSGLVKVSLAVDGASSSEIQKSISVSGTDFTYQYMAVPQWSSDNQIQGKTDDWTTIYYSDGMSLGYFTSGLWKFYIRILNNGTPVYSGETEVVDISTSQKDVTVTVAKIIGAATGVVDITIKAPTIADDDTLTVAWSGTSSGTAGADKSVTGGITTFTYTTSSLPVGAYTFTFTHNNVNRGATIAVDLLKNEVIMVSGQIENGEWQLGYITMPVRNITVKRYNWNDVEHPWDYSQTPKYCGTVDIDIDSAVPGDRVSFSANPATNSYVVGTTVEWSGGSITPDYDLNNHLYSFIMPDGDVTITVKFFDVEPVEVDALLFKTIVQALYDKNDGNVFSFGKAANSPGTGVSAIALGDVQIWYDSSEHKICWYSNTDTVQVGAGSLDSLFKNGVTYTAISMEGIVTSAVTNMSGMFQGCTNLEALTLGTFDTHNVANMSGMFQGCTALTSLNLASFNASKATNLSNMFEGCTNLVNLIASSFTTNTSSGVNMSGLFRNCVKLKKLNNNDFALPSGFNTSKATNMSGMFQGCAALTSLNLGSFNASNVINLSNMFADCTNLVNLTFSSFTTYTSSNTVNMSGLFKNCAKLNITALPSGFNASRATNLSSMFEGCAALTSLDLTNFNASSATKLDNMFKGCTNLQNLTLTGFTTNTTANANVSMAGLFWGCNNLFNGNGTLTLPDTFNTTEVTDMHHMFCGCYKLETIDFGHYFNTAKVKDMSYMFSSASTTEPPLPMAFTSLPVGDFNTANVTNMSHMFYMCHQLTSFNVANFNTAKVTKMDCMFACYNYQTTQCPGELTTLNLANWDFTNVTTTAKMFDRQEKLNDGLTFPEETNFKSLTDLNFMFSQCRSLSPAKLGSIVGTWNFTSNTKFNSIFDNFSTSTNGKNFIIRPTMLAGGDYANFAVRQKYTTYDGKILYIGGSADDKNCCLTTKIGEYTPPTP